MRVMKARRRLAGALVAVASLSLMAPAGAHADTQAGTWSVVLTLAYQPALGIECTPETESLSGVGALSIVANGKAYAGTTSQSFNGSATPCASTQVEPSFFSGTITGAPSATGDTFSCGLSSDAPAQIELMRIGSIVLLFLGGQGCRVDGTVTWVQEEAVGTWTPSSVTPAGGVSTATIVASGVDPSATT